MGEQPKAATQLTATDGGRAQQFRAAISRMATPVTVVTSDGTSGRIGLTVSAMSLVSFDPPIVLVCIGRQSPANQLIQDNGTFRVNVLGRGHDHVSDTFAGRPWPGKEKWDFTCGDWELNAEYGPRLVDAVASVACRVHSVLSVGSHCVYLGEVAAARETDSEPLVYLRGAYCLPVPEPLSTFPEYPDAEPAHTRTRTSR